MFEEREKRKKRKEEKKKEERKKRGERLHNLWSIQHFTSTFVVTLHLRPLRSSDRAAVEPALTRAAGDTPRRKHETSVDVM